jgi:hypothetical protein
MTKADQARIMSWRLKVLRWSQGEARQVERYKVHPRAAFSADNIAAVFITNTTGKPRRMGFDDGQTEVQTFGSFLRMTAEINGTPLPPLSWLPAAVIGV